MTRLPFQPLERVAAAGRYPHVSEGCPGCTPTGHGGDPPGRCYIPDQLGEWIGLSGRQVARLRKSGLTPKQADRLAINIGSHPEIIWPTDWRLAEIFDELQRRNRIRSVA